MSNPFAVVESLEGRSLLSAVPLPMLTYAHVWPSSSQTQANSLAHKDTPLKARKQAKHKPFKIAGDWDGRYQVKAFPFKFKYDLSAHFDSVAKSTAQGTVTIDDHDYTGRWTGLTNKQKGYFSYTLKKHGDKLTITGTLNAQSTYAWGTINLDWGWRSSKGDFSMTRI